MACRDTIGELRRVITTLRGGRAPLSRDMGLFRRKAGLTTFYGSGLGGTGRGIAALSGR